MALTTIMYHYVLDEQAGHMSRTPHLTTEMLRRHLTYIQKHGTLLRPGESVEWFARSESEDRFFLTFDDSLRCHVEDVAPILAEFGVRGGFSIYSEPVLEKRVSLLEKQRFLQYNLWDYSEFLRRFVETAGQTEAGRQYKSKLRCDRAFVETHSFYLSEETYYSQEERYYRYLRDVVFQEREFSLVIDEMFARFCNEESVAKMLFMAPQDVRALHDAGHEIIPHSLSHPIRLDKLTRAEMHREVAQSMADIEALTGAKPEGFSYPCGRVTETLFEIVQELGVRYAFVGGDSSNFSVAGPELLKLYRIDASDFTRIIEDNEREQPRRG